MKNVTTIMAGALAAALLSAGVPALAASEGESKEIRVEARAEQGIAVDFKAVKASFAVDEPIAFTARTDKDAYLYLFYAQGESWIQLFPNRSEKANKIPANTAVTFPSKVTFKSDRAGVEKFMLVASATRFELPSREVGNTDWLEVPGDELDKATKNIVVEGPRRVSQAPLIEAERGRAAKLLKVTITDGELMAGAEPAAEERALVLLSTDKYSYRVSEPVVIGYAADRDGTLKLYLVGPDRRKTLVKETKVAKNRIYRLSAKASAPAGEHALVAEFLAPGTESSPQFDEFISSLSEDKAAAKGLVLDEPATVTTVHRFQVRK